MDDFSTGFICGQSDNGGNNGSGNGYGFGGEWLWAIILLACLWGNWGGNGNNGGNNGGGGMSGYIPFIANQDTLTRSDLCSEFAFNDLQNATRGISQGICDSTFALNNTIVNGFNGVSSAICNIGYENAMLNNTTNQNIANNRFAAQQNTCQLENAITQNRFDNQVAINGLATQLSQCCCDAKYQRATDTCAIQTSLANNTRDIIDAQNANTRELMNFMVNSKMEALQSENQSLKLAASQAAQNSYLISELRPIAQPCYVTCNPYTGQYGYVGNNGCNSGCGCC